MLLSRIVVNALQYKKNSSGIGILIRNLFGELSKIRSDDTTIILSMDSPSFPAGKEIRIPYRYSQNLKRIFFQSFLFGNRFCKKSVLLTTDSKVPFFLPQTCFMIPVITDLAVYRMPETYRRSRVLLWKLQYRYLIKRADYFLAISEFTKRDLMSLFDIPGNKIDVVYCGVSENMRPVTDHESQEALYKRYNLPEKYILFVGNFNPRKNLERIIKAFDKVKEKGITHKLVIAGGEGWKFDKQNSLKDVTYKEDILFLSYIPDDDMPVLYSCADLFLFPTLYEGFGIPILEAQACGIPVLTSRCSAMPEIGGQGALYVDPTNIDEICKGILSIINDSNLAAKLTQNGFENIKRFSWATSAQKLNEILEKVTNR